MTSPSAPTSSAEGSPGQMTQKMSLRSQKLGALRALPPKQQLQSSPRFDSQKVNLDEACWGFIRQPLNNNKTAVTEGSFTRCYHLPRLHFLMQNILAAAFCSGITSAALPTTAQVSPVAEESPPCLGARREEQQREKSQGSAPAQAREALEGGCLVGCP